MSGAGYAPNAQGRLHLLIVAFSFVRVGNVFNSQFLGGDSFRFRVRLSIQIGAGEDFTFLGCLEAFRFLKNVGGVFGFGFRFVHNCGSVFDLRFAALF